MRLFLGLLLAAAPFVAIFILAAKTCGWRVAVGIFGIVAAIVGCIVVGIWLASGLPLAMLLEWRAWVTPISRLSP